MINKQFRYNMKGFLMQRLSILFFVILFLVLMISCESKKTETEYFNFAYEQYNKAAYNEAIETFNKILEYYPDGENTPKATFMIGFIYANDLNNLDEAKKYYTLFLEKYPEHDLADDAEYELKTLGQDINDLPIFKDAAADEKQATGN